MGETMFEEEQACVSLQLHPQCSEVSLGALQLAPCSRSWVRVHNCHGRCSFNASFARVSLGGGCGSYLLFLLVPMASKLAALRNNPAGPKTIHFWAPTFKWGISIANVADFSKPPENISYAQQMAVTCTGVVWSRYAMVIVPKNYNLFAVNIAMGVTGIYQLSRKLQQDYMGVPDAPLKKVG